MSPSLNTGVTLATVRQSGYNPWLVHLLDSVFKRGDTKPIIEESMHGWIFLMLLRFEENQTIILEISKLVAGSNMNDSSMGGLEKWNGILVTGIFFAKSVATYIQSI